MKEERSDITYNAFPVPLPPILDAFELQKCSSHSYCFWKVPSRWYLWRGHDSLRQYDTLLSNILFQEGAPHILMLKLNTTWKLHHFPDQPVCVCSAKFFYGAAAGYTTAFVSLLYCSCIIFPLFAVAVPVKFVLLRVALELLPHLLSFCRYTLSFVKFLFHPHFNFYWGQYIFYLQVCTGK